MTRPRQDVRWAVQWRSQNRIDGRTEHFLWSGATPLLFRSRDEARRYIQERYGYIKDRPDLRREPHGWMLPRPVKVSVRLEVTE